MTGVENPIPNDRLAILLGIELTDCRPGYAKARMKIEDKHLNHHGLVHGGAIFSLADLVFAAASNSYGVHASAINASIQFLRAATGGELFAEATENHCGKTIASYTIDVTSAEGKKIAVFQGMVFRRS